MLTHPPRHDFRKHPGADVHPNGGKNVDVEGEIIRGALRGVWPSLPALLVASAAICAAAAVPVVVAPGVNPIAVVVAALVCGPLLPALAAVADEMTTDGHGTIRTWWCTLRSQWRFGLTMSLVAAIPAALLLVAVEVWRVTGSAAVAPSFVASGIVTLVAVLGLTAAIPLGTARTDLRGTRLWRVAVSIVAVRPTRFVAVASAAGFGIWAATHTSASVLLLVPAPTAIVAATATWTTVAFVERTTSP
jgi:hypothetical protein